ncbi:MAG: hypothetical protein IPJ16_05695 [Bacteroidales bacterium]|nr:hypothetical protein [Bacteroidales bacterium]
MRLHIPAGYTGKDSASLSVRHCSNSKGKATRLTKLEIISYEPATHVTACPPGTYDVLVNYGNGVKYEWRKGL